VHFLELRERLRRFADGDERRNGCHFCFAGASAVYAVSYSLVRHEKALQKEIANEVGDDVFFQVFIFERFIHM